MTSVVVIGGGIVGASTANHLARAGAEVTVIDRAQAGKATLAGAGIVCPWASEADDGPWLDLYIRGASYYRELLDELGVGDAEPKLGYRRVGALVVSNEGDDLDAAEERIARRSGDGADLGLDVAGDVGEVSRLDNTEARALFPPLRTGLDALHISGGARVDGRLLAEALLERSDVARVVSPARADLLVDGSRVAGVRVGLDTVVADAVVVAGGAWTNDVLAPLGLGEPIDVEPQKGQILHLGLTVDTSRWPVLLPPGPHYLLAFDDGRVVVGATRETGSGFDTRVTAAGQAEVLDTALSIAPGLANAELLETRVGLRPLAAGLPSLGPVPGVDGLWVGTGLGPAGLTIGPVFGRALADLVLDRPPVFPVEDFAPVR
ncbi:MAG: FAD-dependent oxidoreductase [Actinomycetota bacterium]